MKIQCVILAMFLSIYVVCIKLMTYGNIFGLETLLSSVTGMGFSASTKLYSVIIVVPTYISRKTKYHQARFIDVKMSNVYIRIYIYAQNSNSF